MPDTIYDIQRKLNKFSKQSFPGEQRLSRGKKYQILLMEVKSLPRKDQLMKLPQELYALRVEFSLRKNIKKNGIYPEFLKVYFYDESKNLVTVLGKMFTDMGGTKDNAGSSVQKNHFLVEFIVEEELIKKAQYFLAVVGDSVEEIVVMVVPEDEIADFAFEEKKYLPL